LLFFSAFAKTSHSSHEKLVGMFEYIKYVLLMVFLPIISDVISNSGPANKMSVSLSFRIQNRFHAAIVQRIRFGEVDYGEPVFHVSSHVLKSTGSDIVMQCL
jgi:hypothetical protein